MSTAQGLVGLKSES